MISDLLLKYEDPPASSRTAVLRAVLLGKLLMLRYALSLW